MNGNISRSMRKKGPGRIHAEPGGIHVRKDKSELPRGVTGAKNFRKAESKVLTKRS